jgi:hypothetical protein
MAMLAGLPYTAVRDAVIAHPTMPEGLIPLFGNVPPIQAAMKRGFQTREAEMALPRILGDSATTFNNHAELK